MNNPDPCVFTPQSFLYFATHLERQKLKQIVNILKTKKKKLSIPNCYCLSQNFYDQEEINDDEFEIICYESTHKFTTLLMSPKSINDDGMRYFPKGNQKNLTVLNLGNNKITMKYLTRSSMPALQTLDLSSNFFGDERILQRRTEKNCQNQSTYVKIDKGDLHTCQNNVKWIVKANWQRITFIQMKCNIDLFNDFILSQFRHLYSLNIGFIERNKEKEHPIYTALRKKLINAKVI